MNFTRKGYGRIYVDKDENIEKVVAEIKDIDEFEYDYLPDNFIVNFSEYPYVIYTGKFDSIDINELTARCWKKGIHIFCLDNKNAEFVYGID